MKHFSSTKFAPKLLLCVFAISGHTLTLATTSNDTMQHAVFAGGCFWCMEEAFESIPGVAAVVSGYANGHVENPSYQAVSTGKTGHYEVVQVTYDPKTISYDTLLKYFWRNIDPTDGQGQFCDKGQQYQSAIFYLDETQKKVALASFNELKASKQFETIYTLIEQAKQFYAAEQNHQDYYKKNPVRYKLYKTSCGRTKKLNEIWGQ